MEALKADLEEVVRADEEFFEEASWGHISKILAKIEPSVFGNIPG